MQSVPEGPPKLLNRMVSRNKQSPWGSFRGISSLVIHLSALLIQTPGPSCHSPFEFIFSSVKIWRRLSSMSSLSNSPLGLGNQTEAKVS